MSCSCEGCHFLVAGAKFTNNSATDAGGGLFPVGKGLNTTLTAAHLTGNVARAGGGFLCHSGHSTLFEGAVMTNNVADSYGGGAAIVQGEGPITISSSTFRRNAAATPGSGPIKARGSIFRRNAAPMLGVEGEARAMAPVPAPENARRRRHLLQVVTDGVDDSWLYPGGGGLYLSNRGPITLSGNTIAGNSGANGGARFDGVDTVLLGLSGRERLSHDWSACSPR